MEQPPWHTQPSAVNQVSIPTVPNDVNFTDNDKNPESSFPIGWIILGIIIVVVLIILGFGIFFFFENSKTSTHELPELNDNLDYQLNPLFAGFSTLIWKNHSLDYVKAKYPLDWELKPVRLLTTEADEAFTLKGKKGDITFFRTNSKISSCSQFVDTGFENIEDRKKKISTSSQANYINERGATRINGNTFRLFFLSTDFQGIGSKSLSVCIENSGQVYLGSLQEEGPGRDFKNLKEFILFLNSLEFSK